MTTPKRQRKEKKTRNYRKEYDNYHSSSKQKKDRASRNKARSNAIKKGTAKKGDGKEVDHKDRNPRNNSAKNTRVVKRSKNRSFSRKTKDRKKYGKRYA
jgi:hypothetical protein